VFAAAMLEKVEGLELAEHGAAVLDGHDDLHRCQSRPQVCGHVVQACKPAQVWNPGELPLSRRNRSAELFFEVAYSLISHTL